MLGRRPMPDGSGTVWPFAHRARLPECQSFIIFFILTTIHLVYFFASVHEYSLVLRFSDPDAIGGL